MSQHSQFLGLLHQGQQMSLVTVYPATIVFVGMGSSDGYQASAGLAVEGVERQGDGTLMPIITRNFRVASALLAADSLTLVPQQTKLTAGGKSYRLDSVESSEADPCLLLICRQV